MCGWLDSRDAFVFDTDVWAAHVAKVIRPAIDEQLADAWDAGREAERKDRAEREEEARVLKRLGIDWPLHVRDSPANPYRSVADWDF